MMKLTAVAICGACDWTTDGLAGDVDRAAEKHTKADAHPTAVRVVAA